MEHLDLIFFSSTSSSSYLCFSVFEWNANRPEDCNKSEKEKSEEEKKKKNRFSFFISIFLNFLLLGFILLFVSAPSLILFSDFSPSSSSFSSSFFLSSSSFLFYCFLYSFFSSSSFLHLFLHLCERKCALAESEA
jgi:hypothetical protein